ncbi:MAG TPA: hypothetical protein VGX28_10810 [Frankiaceae bacterium]|nr:hypothetical protein [Frankiaceae bacterium]
MNGVDDRLERHAARWQREASLPEARLVAPRRRWWPAAALAVAGTTAVVVVATVAVTAGRDEPGEVARDAGRGRPAVAAADLDRYDTAAAPFFARLAGAPGASEAERYGSLRDAYRSAGVVLVAEVTGVRATRSLPEGSRDAVSYVGVVLRPVEVLRGGLREPGAEVVVEFMGDAEAVRASMPTGYGVWLLRNKGDLPPGVVPKPGAPALDESAYYRLVSSQGLFVQGATHVVNPVRERATPEAGGTGIDPEATGPRDPVAREAEAFPALSALVAHLRQAG